MRTLAFFAVWGLVTGLASVGCSSSGGACSTDADCGGDGRRCLFPIGSCGAAGQCFDRETGPECLTLVELCGCDGETVVTGCGYPDQFASGPTTGASATTCHNP